MPTIITGNMSGTGRDVTALRDANYDYKYPRGLNLKPNSPLHEKLKIEILQRAQESNAAMKNRFDSWRKLDQTLTVFIPANEAERETAAKDSRRPVPIVVPMIYAVLDTMLTYLSGVYLRNPLLPYQGVDWGDTIGTALMEKVIELQMQRFKAALSIYTMCRDAVVYGMGIASPVWTTDWRKTLTTTPQGYTDVISGQFVQTGEKQSYDSTVAFEGNKIININPYGYLPDVNVAAHQQWDGEYCGWVARENRMNLLGREKDGSEGLFNIKYLKHIPDAVSQYSPEGKSDRDRDGVRPSRPNALTSNIVDVIYMHVNLIPKEWELGPEEYPEKWVFGLAGDAVIVQADKLGLDHDKIPVAVAAPGFDGYSVTPISKLEVIFGLQHQIDFNVNSRNAFIDNSLNGRTVYDPLLINSQDMQKRNSWIRMRPNAMGRNLMDQAIKQLSFPDATQSNIPDSLHLIDMMMRSTGITDSLQGMVRGGSERRTAEENRSTRASAVARQELVSSLTSMQGMRDLSYLIAMQTQQLMTKEQSVRITGRWSDVLANEYGMDAEFVKVTADMLNVNFDTVPYDNPEHSSEDPQVFLQMLQAAQADPELSQRVDKFRVFMHGMRIMGVKNVEDFARRQPMMPGIPGAQGMVAPTEDVMNEVQKGNLVPIEQANGGMPMPMMGDMMGGMAQ